MQKKSTGVPRWAFPLAGSFGAGPSVGHQPSGRIDIDTQQDDPSSDENIELVDLAVRSGLFPLYEVFDGERYTINMRPDGTDLREYLSRQRRYAGSALDVDAAAASPGSGASSRRWRSSFRREVAA